MKVNTKSRTVTHEGGPARTITPIAELRRSVLSCLLWEGEFYEDGDSIADRISSLCEIVDPEQIASLAIEARTKFHLRHVPLLLLVSLVRRGKGRLVEDTVYAVIQRADELAELLAIYWRGGRAPLSNPMKRGLARAFQKFSPHSLAKYNSRKNSVSLRDVLFLCHPRPIDDAQAETWGKLVDGTLEPPDTWEVSLSRGDDKKATFERLIAEGKLGYLALLRNLKNATDAGVDGALLRSAILLRRGAEKVLPFRYVAAARAVPSLEPVIDIAMLAAISELPRLSGTTVVLVDISGSMHTRVSSRSDMTRMDAAASLASILNCENVRVFSFTDTTVEVAPRRGMAGVDAIVSSQSHGGTLLGDAVKHVNQIPHDRLVVITDEQTADDVPSPVADRAYLINVASYQKGIGYGPRWTHIDGFSESVIRFICEHESQG